ncbi:MAG: DUF3237 domain-containing protein [Alteraurantiacibacter sp.]
MINRREMLGGAAVAGAAALAATGSVAAAHDTPTSAPVLEKNGMRYRHAFSVSVFFRERVTIDAPFRRAFVPAIGGEIWGPRLSGVVVPYGGADFGGGGGPLDAHYMFQADDGHLIYINNRGYMRRIGSDPADGVRRSVSPVAADGTFSQEFVSGSNDQVPLRMRTSPFFDAPANSPHAWMNSTLFIGHGLRMVDPDRTIFTYYEVL